MSIGPLVVFGMSALSPLVVSSVGLSRGEFGAIAGIAFAVAMCSSVISGYVVDRWSGRVVPLVMSGSAALGIVTVGSGSSVVSVWLAAGFSGVAIALGNPATNQLISERLGGRGGGVIVGLKQAGVPLAQMLIGFLLPLAGLAIGWRAAMLVLLVLPVVNVVLIVRTVPRAPRGRTLQARPAAVSPASAVWWLAVYSLLMGMPIQATNAYMPLYAHEQLGLNLTTAALSMTLAGAVGLLARMALGWLSDVIAAPENLLVPLALISALGSLLVWEAGRSDQPVLFWVGVTVHGSTAIAAIVVTTVVLVRSVDRAAVGMASGVLAMGQFAGFSVGPILFGVVVELDDSYAPAWLSCVLLYLLACAVAWLQLRQIPSIDSKTVVRYDHI